jgi:hypothetical protein
VLASYARPAQQWRFYEIDPAVERIARHPRFFSFLADCGERCTVITGDARLSLARAPEPRHDLLVLDAFSSDAIPVHLLTSEAFGVYLSRLADGGAILLHFSNRHLALLPLLGRVAQAHRLVAVAQADPAGPGSFPGKLPSEWMILVRDARDLGPLIVDPRWPAVAVPKNAPLWTDDYSNVLSLLRWRSPSRR